MAFTMLSRQGRRIGRNISPSSSINLSKYHMPCLSEQFFFSSNSNNNNNDENDVKCAPSPKASLAGKKAFHLCNTASPPPSSMATFLSHAGLPSSSTSDENVPLSSPLEFATTYSRPPDGNYTSEGKIYGRMDNITRETLENVVGTMEIMPSTTSSSASNQKNEKESKKAISAAFSSGMSAVHSLLLSHESPLHIILPDDVYHGVPTQFHTIFTMLQDISWSMVDMNNLDKIEDMILDKVKEMKKGSVVVWMETPSNPLCKVTDIENICNLVDTIRGKGMEEAVMITTVVDSTWAPPCITQPLLIGADAVLHSGTKYFGGHSDVLLGVVTCSPYTYGGIYLGQKLKTVQSTIGAVASPFDCWLTLRGLRTLHVRLQKQCESAMSLAIFLESHEFVQKVHYPGLSSHQNHQVACKQMKDGWYGGMLSFEVQNEEMAIAVAGAVRTITRATSLGGTETLIEHRASIEPADRITSPMGLLRVSVGLENADDLMADLDEALNVAAYVVDS